MVISTPTVSYNAPLVWYAHFIFYSVISFQVVIVTSSATLSSTLFASLFELAASIFAVSPVYILEMSVVHKTTMYIPVFLLSSSGCLLYNI